jgi:enterochelin esterase-like enzyme
VNPQLPRGWAGATAFRKLAEQPVVDSAAVDRFMAETRVPIVEGSNCTFVYRGGAEDVRLRHWIFGLPQSQPLMRLPGTDLWFLTIELPEKSRVEYKFEVARGPGVELVEDPYNPMRARDPFGANSVVYGTGYEVPEWTGYDAEARPGTIEELRVRSLSLGRDEHVSLYLPARFRRSRRYPLLVVHDGGDFLEYCGMKTILDNLIHRFEIPEMIVAFTRPGQRLLEYANHEPHARWLSTELLPKLEANYPLSARASDRGLLGSSFGAVAAFSTAVRYPGVWGRLGLLSGSFAFTDIGRHQRGPYFDPVVEFINEYRRAPSAVSERLFVSCGTYESLIYENRSFIPLLQGTGMEVKFVEAKDGHNWENWRDRLREGLSWLYPGPLWMVYL